MRPTPRRPPQAAEDEDVYPALGRRVAAARLARGLTQFELAARVGLTRSSIGNIEIGRQRFSVDTLCRLARSLGVTPADLLEDRPRTPPDGVRQR